MKFTRILLTFLFLILIGNTFACINEYRRTLLSGKHIYTDPSSGKIWVDEIDTLELRKKAVSLLESYRKNGSIEYLSDYAAALIYLGEYQKAKNIYQGIEAKSPNLYTVASNLGTLYELVGKNDSALFWIKKSLAINADSHEGSEWIHIKILEFKLANKTDYSKSILGLDFGNDAIPDNPQSYYLSKLESQIRYQLAERLNFIKPKDKIVGNIYFDLGNINAQIKDVQTALESYKAAKEYGFESELMDKRIVEFEALAGGSKYSLFWDDILHNMLEHFVLLFIGILILGISILLTIKRVIKRRKKRHNK